MGLRPIQTATVLGANGAMGSGCAAILAGFGAMKVHMLARDEKKATQGIDAAVKSIRSNIIGQRMVAGTYQNDLEEAIASSDWVFECVAETYSVKEDINQRIAKARTPGTLVSTVSSGLSISRLAEAFDDDGKKHYYGTHFFNPPYKLILCELVTHKANDPSYTQELKNYLDKTLKRHVVITNDTPAFAGNRVGFQLMNEAAQYAEKYQEQGGIYLLDSLLGGYTGRAMAPLATIDLVGLDVHKAIVDNIYEHTQDTAHDTFRMPAYMHKLIDKGCLGMKSLQKGGMYCIQRGEDGKKSTQVYNIHTEKYEDIPLSKVKLDFKSEALRAIRSSDYRASVEIFKNAKGLEADILRHFISRYISYSFSLIPEVTDQSGVDGAMGFGFNWLPPSVWVDLLGGSKETCHFIEQQKMSVPDALTRANGHSLYQLQSVLDYRSLFKAS